MSGWPQPTGGRRIVVALFLLLSASLLPADITGTVTLSGKPNSKDETYFAKSNGCGESPTRHTENWKVGPKGELADVVIWIVDPKISGPIRYQTIPPAISQIGCRYTPHVTVARAGDPITIINGDPTLHNIRAKTYDGPGKPPGHDVFNFGQVHQNQTDQKTFDTPGIYTLQCDVHGWMQSWVYILPKAALPECAVSTTDGTFKIIGGEVLDDGDYKVMAWHPRFAETLEQTIHVKKGIATANFQFEGAKSF